MGILHTATKRALVLVLIAALLLLVTASASRRSQSSSSLQTLRRCQRPPRFRVNSEEPMALTRGYVTLVALLTSTCPFCIRQSRALQGMHEEYQANGTDIRMMIVNGGPRPAPGMTGVFEGIVSFPVYHDDDSRTIWRQVFKGNKDDILLFDRCGKLTYRIPFPYSYLGYSFVSRGLQRSLEGNVCSCQPTADPNDTMMGDAPVSQSVRRSPSSGFYRRGNRLGQGRAYKHIRRERGQSFSSRNMNRSRCPPGDALCRDLRRSRRRFNRYRRLHGIEIEPRMPEREILELFQRSQRGSMGPAF